MTDVFGVYLWLMSYCAVGLPVSALCLKCSVSSKISSV